MAMKQRKSCGNLQIKISAKHHAKNYFQMETKQSKCKNEKEEAASTFPVES